jgi:hypothetical protein
MKKLARICSFFLAFVLILFIQQELYAKDSGKEEKWNLGAGFGLGLSGVGLGLKTKVNAIQVDVNALASSSNFEAAAYLLFVFPKQPYFVGTGVGAFTLAKGGCHAAIPIVIGRQSRTYETVYTQLRGGPLLCLQEDNSVGVFPNLSFFVGIQI